MTHAPTRKYITSVSRQIVELKKIVAEIFTICKRLEYADSLEDMSYKCDNGNWRHQNPETAKQQDSNEYSDRPYDQACDFIYDMFIGNGLTILGGGAYRNAYGYKDLVFKISTDDSEGCPNTFELRQYKNMLKSNIKYLALPMLGSMKVNHERVLIFPLADIGSRGKGKLNKQRMKDLHCTFSDMHSGNYGTFMGLVFATDFGGHDGDDFKGNDIDLLPAVKKSADKLLAPFFRLQKKTLKA